MTRTQILVVHVPPGEWLTANGRYHWAERSRRTRALRTRAGYLARAAHLAHHGPDEQVHVTAYVHGRTRGRMDPANAAPTVKAVIDGLTDTRVWVDDDHAHLLGPDYRRGAAAPDLQPGWHQITLHITDHTEEDQ